MRDPRACSTPLDRNQRARILHLAEQMERATKGKGRRNGTLGYVGLAVLRCLLLRFHNARDGLCCPSYDTLEAATGLCRQSIATALQRLAAVGILRVVRRLARAVRGGVVRCEQATNLYAFTMPSERFIPIPPGPQRVRRSASAAPAMFGRESMVQGATYKPPLTLPKLTGGDNDWRAIARLAFKRVR